MHLKNDRPCVPEIIMVQATTPTTVPEKGNSNVEELTFYNLMIEDSTQFGDYNFSQFLETVQMEASKLLGGRKST